MEFEDEEEDKILLMHLRKSKSAHEMYNKRRSEGIFRTQFENHLSNDETLFHKYLRFIPQIFYDLLSCIENDIKMDPPVHFSSA